ncbi:Dna Topoisomerase I [Manis pentadactyla]|nr:Dna Topoisomerase I [Manis pentadactyla]
MKTHAAGQRQELAGAPREAGAEGRLRGVSLEPAVRSRGGLGECVDCELFQNSVLRTHYFNIWKKHIQREERQVIEHSAVKFYLNFSVDLMHARLKEEEGI